MRGLWCEVESVSMGAIEERSIERHMWASHASGARPELVYTQAGIAVPRQAHERQRIGRARRQEPVRYEAQTFWGRSTRYADTLEDAYRLRAGVFMGELGWLAPSADGRECDRCDPMAKHFVVFARQPDAESMSERASALVGYARVLLPRHGFMMEREFAELATRLAPDTERAFEVSRFVVAPAHRGRRCVEGRTVVDHLARAIAGWALSRGRTDWYTVCEARYLRALRLRGLRFTQLGHAVEYQPGVAACAAVLRLPLAAAQLRTHHAADYAWYVRGGRP